MNKKLVIALMGAAAGIAGAANISLTTDITNSVTWTSNNVYRLVGQRYVKPGATLTIEAGTVVKSTSADGGSLAVSRGGKIYVNGTKDHPVIMTSTNDNLTVWHEGCAEWGNLTLMGKGLISASTDTVRSRPGNTKTPTGLNQVQMEGLAGGSETYYGGNDDDDDSGALHYLSLRYGGTVLGFNTELNGLSMGGIGRGTDVDHIDIMNNVDDGIETWGGTVNYKYVNIWNIGDDSMDIDQGWRGKAQFGLIVQGYSTDAAQGSGVGDNCFEIDGAEDSDAQPVTTTRIANFTVVGWPKGDGACTYRDNARVQYHNCLFMDIGEEIVRLDGNDGDGAQGYNYAINGVYAAGNSVTELTAFQSLWSAPYTTYYTQNWATNVYATQAAMYAGIQTSGNLCELRGSVFYNCASDADDKVVAVGALDGSIGALQSKPSLNNIVATTLPIRSYARGPEVTKGGLKINPVTNIVPLASGDAVAPGHTVEADGFFTPVTYAGGFSPYYNWLQGWTAVDAYHMTDTSMNGNNPSSTIQMTASTFWQSEYGVIYTVEESSDMSNWSPVATVDGDGSIMAATDLASFDSAKFYRVVVQ